MKKKPLLTVIISTYNQADTLKISLNSIFNQELEKSKYEVIIINDGSTDHTDSVVKEFIKKFSKKIKIRYRRRKNKGLPYSKNEGIKLALANYIITIDTDQELTKGVLKECLESMKDYDMLSIPEIGVEGNLISRFVDYERKINFYKTNRDIPRFYKKDIFKKVGFFDSSLWLGEDWDMYQRALLKGYKAGIIKNNFIKHHEVNRLFPLIRKYFVYGTTSNRLINKHQKRFYKMYSGLDKRIIFNMFYFFFRNPALWMGAMFIKFTRYASALIGLMHAKILKK